MSCNGNSDIYSCVNKGIWVSPYNGITGPTGAMGPTGPIGPTGASVLLNLVDGNETGSIRQVGTPTGYTMGLNSSAFGSSIASGDYSFAEGFGATASGFTAHAEGYNTFAGATGTHAEGEETRASGEDSHAEGYITTASGYASHAEGEGTIASESYSHAEGHETKAIGLASHSEGYGTRASGDYSHSEGFGVTAVGDYSHAGGFYTIAQDYQTVIGKFNEERTGGVIGDTTGSAFIIGNGTSNVTRSNAFRVSFNGTVYATNTLISTGADYAEMFEWQDGNPDNEDRVGYFVTTDGIYIRKATDKDSYILGVVSGTPSIIGDGNSEQWKDKYVRDKWGRIVYDWIDVEEKEVVTEDNMTVEKLITRQRPVAKLNPLYDQDKEYVSRTERKEWNAVGMLGKLLVRDDGSCVVNGFCMPNEEGIATSSLVGYRVLARIDVDQILIVFVIK